MKKLILSAAIALAAVTGYAQGSGSGPLAGPAAASDNSTVIVGLLLDNIIQLNPPLDLMGAHFNSHNDYNNGEELTDIFGNHTSNFTVSSNRNFNVTIKSSAPNFLYLGTGTGNNIMPCSVLKYNLFSNGTGGTNATPATWNPLAVAAAPLINNGTYGANKPFSLKFRAEPGWSYTGGSYTLGVVLTATQL